MEYPKLVIRQNTYPSELKKGEAIIVLDRDETKGLILCCPKCGYAATGNHKYNEKTQTLKPSIECGGKGCGFHGNLVEGIFTDA